MASVRAGNLRVQYANQKRLLQTGGVKGGGGGNVGNGFIIPMAYPPMDDVCSPR